jgi:hypothetical protein
VTCAVDETLLERFPLCLEVRFAGESLGWADWVVWVWCDPIGFYVYEYNEIQGCVVFGCFGGGFFGWGCGG